MSHAAHCTSGPYSSYIQEIDTSPCAIGCTPYSSCPSTISFKFTLNCEH